LVEAAKMRRSDLAEARRRSLQSIAAQVRAMLELRKLGAIVFDFGNGIFERAREAGVAEAGAVPGFVEAYLGAALGGDRAAIRWVALSGERGDIERIDRLVLDMFPDDEVLGRFIGLAQKHVRAQGLPARVCWMRRGELVRFAVGVNDLVASGELKGPIVVGRDFADCGAGGDAGEEPPLAGGDGGVSAAVQGMLDAAGGAAWAAVPARGTARRGGQAVVAEGGAETARRIERVMER
jgi:urocanate hydratase